MSSPLSAARPSRISNPKRTFALLRGGESSTQAETVFATDPPPADLAQALRIVTSGQSEPENTHLHAAIASPHEPVIENAIADSLQQTQELVELLSKREQALTQRDVEFQVKTWNWQQESKKIETKLTGRAAQLDERETQLMALQFELFQLQHQLIDSQLATREIVEDLALGSANPHSIATLKSLQFELGQRFDHVYAKWSEMVNRLESIATDIAEKVAMHDRSATHDCS